MTLYHSRFRVTETHWALQCCLMPSTCGNNAHLFLAFPPTRDFPLEFNLDCPLTQNITKRQWTGRTAIKDWLEMSNFPFIQNTPEVLDTIRWIACTERRNTGTAQWTLKTNNTLYRLTAKPPHDWLISKSGILSGIGGPEHIFDSGANPHYLTSWWTHRLPLELSHRNRAYKIGHNLLLLHKTQLIGNDTTPIRATTNLPATLTKNAKSWKLALCIPRLWVHS